MNPVRFQYAKPIYAAIVAFLGALASALVEDEAVSLSEWVAIASATVVAAGAVFGVAGTEPRRGGPVG